MSRQINHVFATMVGEVVPGPTAVKGGKLRSSFRYEITNTMRTPVFWRNALGILVCEPSDPSTVAEEGFYIKIAYEFDPGVKIDARELLDELNLPDNHVERKGIFEALQALEREPQWYRQRTFHYTVGITREVLEEAGGVVYLNDVDLVVGFDRYRDAVLHPYSPPGQRQRLAESLDPASGFQQRLLLIDNSGIIGPRWINTGFGTFELRPSTDPELQDGVYLSVQHSRAIDPKTTFYTIKEAEAELGLYRTAAEAEAYGSPEDRFKAEIKAREQAIARDKVEYAERKQEYEREKAEFEAQKRREDDRRQQEQAEFDAETRRHQQDMERQQERIRIERERLDFERQTYTERQKFEYDMSQRDRKDKSEAFKAAVDVGKAVLGIVSVGLSLYAVIKKNTT